MSETPEEIRARIERTRADVSGDVDALAEKVSPSGVVGRQTERVKGALGDVKDRIFGSDDSEPGMVGNVGSDVRQAAGHMGEGVRNAAGNVGEGVRNVAGNVGEGVRGTADRAARKAKGNPLAVGLIAFGVGALVASMIPASSKEKELASRVKDEAQPLVEGAKDVAKEAGEHLKEPVQQAAQSVRETAMEAGQHVKEEAQGAADDVRSDAEQARDRVQDQAQS